MDITKQSRVSVPRYLLSVRITTALIVVSFLLGCSTTPQMYRAELKLLAESGYDFIHDGVSTRNELRTRLGEPIYKFENDRILIYRCRNTEKGIMLLSGIQPEHWQLTAGNVLGTKETAHSYRGSLVLVFDANGILQKHSLVVSK